VLACGALDVDRRRFFLTVAAVRLARYGTEAALARLYGRRLLQWMESDVFSTVLIAFIVIAVAGSAYSIYRLFAGTSSGRPVRGRA
jgi:hypothetical protein